MTASEPLGAGVVLVSIPKAGTHLVTKLFEQLDYYAQGWAAQSDDAPVQYDDFLARLARDERMFPTLRAHFSDYDFDAVWTLVYRYLRRNAGDAAFSSFLYPDDLVANKVLDHVEDMTQIIPRGYMLTLHELEWMKASVRVLDAVRPDGTPKLVFCYRDPRDQLLSMVRFIESHPMMDDHPIGRIYRPILASFSTPAQRLDFAIHDQGFPFREAYRKNRWLLHHPDVLSIRYEDLVGAQGGGSDARQLSCVERVLSHVGSARSAKQLAAALYGGTKTFARGQLAGFRNTLSSALQTAFEKELGDVLSAYGYA